ncbi:hypothetical protein CALVIDRAFT_528942 [Calocera viscosa TUFC12733]|uniref:Uncharacterized protein n=1 Tax=Calocera viscosa (strain TUFC12733) TaxID=1330018 RepID=A0A167K1V4_CALVF|nr:hypothetical protein CALVIDRAFT_528942 [Calocera viscosa TUFC12733]
MPKDTTDWKFTMRAHNSVANKLGLSSGINFGRLLQPLANAGAQSSQIRNDSCSYSHLCGRQGEGHAVRRRRECERHPQPLAPMMKAGYMLYNLSQVDEIMIMILIMRNSQPWAGMPPPTPRMPAGPSRLRASFIPTLPSSAQAEDGFPKVTDGPTEAGSDGMLIDPDYDNASAAAESDLTRVRDTEIIRVARSVVSSVPPVMVVDRDSRKVSRSERRPSAADPSQGMGPPPVQDVDLANIDWEDPLQDEDLLQAQVAAEARGIGERAEAYPWPVEPHIIDWSAYLHNTDRILEQFPLYPSIPDRVYRQSGTWAKDRKDASNQPRVIKDCHRDKHHMHGQAVHAWQAKGAVPRRNLFAKVYLPALYDHILTAVQVEFADRVIGAFVQATFVAKIDNGPARMPEVQVHFSRLIQNNTGMRNIAQKMAIAFKRGIADIAHENFTNYKQLEDSNQARKAQGKSTMQSAMGPPVIPMRDLLSNADLQAVRENNTVPPDIAARVGVQAYRRLDDPLLYTPGELATTAEGAQIPQPDPHDHDHNALLDYYGRWAVDDDDTRTRFANVVSAMYWSCSPLSWRALLAEMLPSTADGLPIDTALKSLESTITILLVQSPIVTNALKTIAAIHDLEHENQLLRQYDTFARQVAPGAFDPLVAKRDHLIQEVNSVEERKKLYLPPLDLTWSEVDRARRAYSVSHVSDSHVSDSHVTPGRSVLLAHSLRFFAAQMDALRSQLAEGSDVVDLHDKEAALKKENHELRERIDERLYARVQDVITAERALYMAKKELQELQEAQDARLREMQAYKVDSNGVDV